MRVMRKHWKLTAVAIFSLSIAMALGVLSLSVANTMLWLRPPGQAPDRLVAIYNRSAEKAIDQVSYPDFLYFRENNQVFTDMAAAPDSIGINGDSDFNGRAVEALSRPVSGNYLAALGVQPFLGRLFAPGDEDSKPPVAVMTYSAWQRLGADPNIVDKVLISRRIIGVTPKNFAGAFYGLDGDLFVPLAADNYNPEWRTERDARRLFLIARLKEGVSRRQAQAEIAALSGQLAQAFPNEDKGRSAVVTRATLLPPDGIPTAELIVTILIVLVVLVLLIACANVANLLLAVAVGRRQEAAIKLALGSSRARLVKEFLVESAIICGVSGLLGFGIASAVVTRYSFLNVDLGTVGEFSFRISLEA